MKFNKEELFTIWNSIKNNFNIKLESGKELDESKLLRQLAIYKKWTLNSAKGLFLGCTGFGKTFIAIIAIKRMNLSRPDFNTIVVVPKTNLKDDWIDLEKGYIKLFNLKNVKVYVINSYIKHHHKCNLLILDECHRYSNEDSLLFSSVFDITIYNYILCLTATLDLQKINFLKSKNINKIDEVSLREAELFGWVSEHEIYNLAINLNEEDLEEERKVTKMFNDSFKKFNQDFDLAKVCMTGNNKKVSYRGRWMTGKEWREWFSSELGWDKSMGDDHPSSPKSIQKTAGVWQYSMLERQSFLHNAINKRAITIDIIKNYNYKSIVFSESTKFIEFIYKELPEITRTYHSKLETHIYKDENYEKLIALSKTVNKRKIYIDLENNLETDKKKLKLKYGKIYVLGKDKLKPIILNNFKKNKFKSILTVRSLNEGMDDKEINLGIITSRKGKNIDNIQRTGRIIRKNGDKKAILINLYVPNSQDEIWLKNSQSNIPKNKIKWIKSIEEINL